jgi:Methyltransferase domain
MNPSEPADVVSSSADYARRFAGPVGRLFLDRQADCTAELLGDIPRTARVLDVGGGHAQLVPMLVGKGFDVTVLGSRPSCSDRLTPWLARGVRFDTGDLLALPYPDRSFDVALCYRLLPHVGRWTHLVSELSRVAASAVVVDYPSRRSVNRVADVFFDAKKRIEGDTRPFAVFDPSDIATAFAREGFAIVGERGQFFFPMAMHRGLGSAALTRVAEAVPRVLGLTAAFGSPRIARADRMPAVQSGARR